MSREFTKREKVMLAIIAFVLIGLGYYYFFFTPNQETIDYYNSLAESEQTMVDSIYAKISKMKKMQAYLETVEETTQSMPKYDNLTNVYCALYDILQDTTYNLSFAGVTESGYIAKRVVGVSYTASSYAMARQIIDRIYDCEYLLQISNISFSISSPCSVSLTITFYEVIDD